MNIDFKLKHLLSTKTNSFLVVLLMACTLTSGCAIKNQEHLSDSMSMEVAKPFDVNDPIEPFNRFMFGFNMFVDRIAIEPIARGYRFAVPKPARNSIGNALDNLKSPVYFANTLLEGDVKGSGKTLARFTINSTIGIVGLFDVASKLGLPLIKRDFGETLASWGSNEGYYVVLPLLGPSNVRDTAGLVADNLMDPFMWIAANSSDANAKAYGYVRTGLKAIDSREKMLDTMDDIKRNSLDLYTATKTMYRQNRKKQVNQTLKDLGREEASQKALYDFDYNVE
ncbi:MAG: VacJ family lipoprotein [Alphaproteobacteria bacterium]